jgi:CRISPR-associated protein Csd1
MITELINLYDRLVIDNDKNLAPEGYSSQKISFAVVLNPDGSLHAIEDRTEPNPNKKGSHPVPVIVLGQTKSSGRSLNPCLLWDTAGYLLGAKEKEDNPKRTRLAHEAFKTKHLALEAEINSPEFSAVCRFLESWSPERTKAADRQWRIPDPRSDAIRTRDAASASPLGA